MTTLLGATLEKKAQTDVGFPVTKATTIFKNEKIPFLNLIDTPGIEHSEEFNPDNILKNVNETDKELKSIVKIILKYFLIIIFILFLKNILYIILFIIQVDHFLII